MDTPHKIEISSSKEFICSGFRLHETGLSPIGTPTLEEWKECGRFLHQAEQRVHFWIGDWLAYGEAHFREDYKQLEEITGYSYHTLRRDKYTAEHIEPERRRPALDVAIHHEVAPLPEKIQEELLTKAETHGYTVQQVRVEKKRIALETARPVVPSLPDSGLFPGDCIEVLEQLPNESIDLLLTDPPYGTNWLGKMRILPFDPIVNDTPGQAPPVLDKSLAVASRKLKTNSHVFVFTSWRSLGWMLDTVEKHFEVKTVLCWVKNYFGMGDYFGTFPSQYEMIIHAQKGRRLLEGETHGNALLFDHVPNNKLIHPAEKPLPLLEYLISRATRLGEVVCDPFMGVASTCLAARNTNRKYIGIEIDEKWFSLAQQRLADHLPEKTA